MRSTKKSTRKSTKTSTKLYYGKYKLRGTGAAVKRRRIATFGKRKVGRPQKRTAERSLYSPSVAKKKRARFNRAMRQRRKQDTIWAIR